MRPVKLNCRILNRYDLPRVAAIAILFAACFPVPSAAQQPGQKTFASPEEASKALAAAAQNNDDKALLAIFGPDGKEIVTSGDPVQDAEHHATFARRYQQLHRLVKEPNGETCLYVGAENWPLPIPIMNKGKVWYFDTDAGKKEMLFRRVGHNEMSAVRVCQELAAAEQEYRSSHNNEYAQKIFSDEGQRNGLYWKAAEGEAQSPIGPLVAEAVAEGYSPGHAGPPTPFRGYFYHILTRQGKDAPAGAKDYIVNGKMTEGAAFIAYPAEYRSSGVMTFIVGTDGTVYEKDLGKKTEALAKAMKEFNPNAGWRKAEQQPAESAAQKKTN